MKVRTILQGQAIRFLRASNPMGNYYMPDVVKALRERYGFVQAPTTLQEFDAQKGITFQHGRFVIKNEKGKREEIVIDKFQVFTDGLLVDTKVYTDDADKFLDDVIQWGVAEFGLKILDDPIKRAYLSSFEVECPDAELPPFPLGKKIEECLRGYGQDALPFDTRSITVWYDTSVTVRPAPYAFIFARREGLPNSSNIYFSSAPLSTTDHHALLVEAGKHFSKKKRPAAGLIDINLR